MSQYSWVPAFKAISTWLEGYEHRQPELIAVLRKIGIDKGLDDEDANGNTGPLTEIDPFTFFSLFMKYGKERCLAYFSALIEEADLNVASPTDNDGVPSAQALKVWLFPFIKGRSPDMVETLWEVFHRAGNKSLDDEVFSPSK